MIEIKVKYTSKMIHEQNNKKEAIKDVKLIVENYLKNGKDIRNIFNGTPKVIYKAKIKDKK